MCVSGKIGNAGLAAATDSEPEAEPTPWTAVASVRVSVCVQVPSASAFALAMAELKRTNESTSIVLSMLTFSWTCTNLRNSMIEVAVGVVISLSFVLISGRRNDCGHPQVRRLQIAI